MRGLNQGFWVTHCNTNQLINLVDVLSWFSLMEGRQNLRVRVGVSRQALGNSYALIGTAVGIFV